MRPFLRGCAIAAAIACAACGGSKDAGPAAPPADARRVDPATVGSLTGRVTFAGTVPSRPPVDVSSERACVDQNPNGIVPEDFVVDNGALENVFVYVKDGLDDYYFDVPAETVQLDQRGCRFIPHVVGLRVHQPLSISNSDDAPHNVHALAAANPGFNKGQALKNMADKRVFTKREIMIPFKCDIHPWMHAYVGVVDHPYFAVTRDGGRFELKNLPPGAYTIEAWHEKLGTKTQQVTVAPKESKEITFTFSGSAGV